MYDVIVVGYGPTGMLAAIKLGRAGHRVAVFERYRTLYNLPRVGIVHDDVLRMFQEIGCDDRIAHGTFFLPVYELANHGKILLSNDVETMAAHGWPEMTSIYQPVFEEVLDTVAKDLPSVDVFQGERAAALSQDADKVTIATEGDGGRRTFEGRYLIGADGGNSFVRAALGIENENFGFDQNWLVIDGRAKRPPRPDLPLLRQFCEPEQPGMTMQMGPDHRRWSFMIFPGESPDEAVKPENVWKRLRRPEGAGPDEFEIIRAVAYQFRSLIAERWRAGRVFLAGDAAHQMPPFLAQGMCSGFRDAYNLAWKLDLLLRGRCTPEFLDTYEAERGPNSRATIVESMRVGQNVNERDPEKVRERDEQLGALQRARDRGEAPKQLIAFRVPGFETGFVANAERTTVKGAGDVFGQGKVRCDGRDGPFDEVAGRGFQIVSRAGDPAGALAGADIAFWHGLDGGFVTLGDGPGDIQDIEGVYTAMMDEYGCDVIVKRHDFYSFGAIPGLNELPALLADMRAQLGVPA
jgi:2-polyprenyl-6-methoxyphenol hydroxylase-like FAD-dependent oxidoreductase